MRITFPKVLPPPERAREEGEFGGFAVESITFETFSETYGILVASVGELATEAFATMSAEQIPDGVLQTALIGVGGRVERDDTTTNLEGHVVRDAFITTALGGRPAHIRIVAKLAEPHLAQAMFIASSPEALDGELGRAFFDSFELVTAPGER